MSMQGQQVAHCFHYLFILTQWFILVPFSLPERPKVSEKTGDHKIIEIVEEFTKRGQKMEDDLLR